MIFWIILIIPLVPVAPLVMPNLDHLPHLVEFASDVGEKVKTLSDLMNLKKECPMDVFLYFTWKQASKVNRSLVRIESQSDIKMGHMVEDLMTKNPLVQKVNTSFIDLHQIIKKIDELWKIFVEHIRNQSTFDDRLDLFIHMCNGLIPSGLQELLKKIHELILPIEKGHSRKNVFLTMLEGQNETESKCDETISQQRTIHQIYSTLALTELRSYVMTVFSHRLLSISDRGALMTIDAELDNAEARFVQRTRDYLVATREAMSSPSNQIRRCDPEKGYERGSTFAEFEGLFQTFIVYEDHLAPLLNCDHDCNIPRDLPFHLHKDYFDEYPKPCQGLVVHCQSADAVTICGMPKNNSRRYQWFNTDEEMYGNGSHPCLATPKYFGSTTQWLVHKCTLCICTCKAAQLGSPALRTISLRESRTNIKKSMVMTGARIVQRYGMIHIQVQQGTLLPQGQIAEADQSWVPLEEFKISDNDTYYVKNNTGMWERLILGSDYVFIRSEYDIVNLDDVIVRQHQIATGIRFNVKDNKKGNHMIGIEVLATPFHYGQGDVYFNQKSNWIGSTQHGDREPVKFNKPDIPTKYLTNVPTTQRNLYVKFQASNLKKDAGQSTIPFWDTQEVITKPASPLQGVGLFFKGHHEGLFGGFLALRIYTLNLTNFLNFTLTESQQDKYNLSYPELSYLPENLKNLSTGYYDSYDENEIL